MKKIAYIENLTTEDIIFDDAYILPAGLYTAGTNGGNISQYTSAIETPKGYIILKDTLEESKVKVYDEYFTELTLAEIYAFWSYRNSIVVKYEGTAFKLYQFLYTDTLSMYNNFSIAPKDIDYKIGLNRKLAPQYIFDSRGFLVEVEYFETVTPIVDPMTGLPGNMFSNPILKVEINYYIGVDGYVSHRDTKRSWQLTNNTYSTDTKTTTKYYDKITAREEGVRRRTNVINGLILELGAFLYLTESLPSIQAAEVAALPLFNAVDTEIDKFTKGNLEPLITKIATIENTPLTTDMAWLENIVPGTNAGTNPGITIRNYAVSKLMSAIVK